jgi:hypothetical protein
MKTLLVGAIGMLVVQALLVMGAYTGRMTPEVINCDRGRQSVTVRVRATFPNPGQDIVRRELGGCNLWFHTTPLGGPGDSGGD